MPMMFEQKSPEALMDLRVGGRMRLLPMSTAVVAAVATVIFTAPTAPVAVVAAIIAVVVMPVVARGAVNHRRRVIPHGWRVVGHGRRAVNDRRRIVNRCAEGYVHRPTRLSRGGEPSDGNYSNQTEQMFCFHARFDGGPARVFENRPLIKMKED